MAMLEIALALVMASAPANAAIGEAELLAGDNRAAIEQIESNDAPDSNDPAALINLGIAHARTGDHTAARSLFQAVAHHRDRIELETTEGKWVDSRFLARQALQMLDRGDFRSERVAAR